MALHTDQPTPDQARQKADHPGVLAHNRPGLTASLVAGTLFLGLAAWLIFTPHAGRPGFDATRFHLPTIAQFVQQWPAPDLSDYPSATAPGYHLVLAVVASTGLDELTVLRSVGALFTLGLIIAVAGVCGRHTCGTRGFVAATPLIASWYVLPAGVMILPDNAALIGVAIVLAMSLDASRRSWSIGRLILCALVLFWTVGARQPTIWVAATIWAAAWFGPSQTTLAQRVRATLPVLVATLPAFALLGAMVAVWGGLTPPMFSDPSNAPVGGTVAQGISPAAPAFGLTLLALYGSAFAAWWWPDRQHRRRTLVFAGAGAAVGLILGIVPNTTFDIEGGRWTGFWAIANALPEIAGRSSPFVVIGAVFGAAVLGATASALRTPQQWVMLTAVAGLFAAQVANANAWQRYFEGPLLIIVALASAHALTATGMSLTRRRLAVIGPVLLAGLLGGITVTEWSSAEVYQAPSITPAPTTPDPTPIPSANP